LHVAFYVIEKTERKKKFEKKKKKKRFFFVVKAICVRRRRVARPEIGKPHNQVNELTTFGTSLPQNVVSGVPVVSSWMRATSFWRSALLENGSKSELTWAAEATAESARVESARVENIVDVKSRLREKKKKKGKNFFHRRRRSVGDVRAAARLDAATKGEKIQNRSFNRTAATKRAKQKSGTQPRT
jgi:hypothetical protein